MFIKNYTTIGLFLITSVYTGINKYSINEATFSYSSTTKYQITKSRIPETINIGLLIPEPGLANELASAAIRGAEIAINQYNSKSEQNKQLVLKLIVRSCEGPWGAGSKAAVDLVFEDKVVAILTSLDGRNAHLAEQVIAKTKVAMISTYETDPTLSQAFVPWYFRCIPNDIQQAAVLTEEIVKRKISKIIIISDDGYDGKLASDHFVKKLASMGKVKPIQIIYNYLNPDFKKVFEQIHSSGIKNIMVFGRPETTLQLVKLLKEKNLKVNIFGSLSVMGEYEILTESLKYLENSVLLTSDHWFTAKGLEFSEEFNDLFGYQPGNAATYAYDGMNVILGAITKTGTSREKIIEEITKTRYEGVTGIIQFDEKGNRMGKPCLMEIKNEIPVKLK